MAINMEASGEHQLLDRKDSSGLEIEMDGNDLHNTTHGIHHGEGWFSRTCGKIYPGSIRGGLFTLCASSMGASSLTMPFIFMQCGIIIGVIIVIAGALINLFSYRILVDAVTRFKIYNYGKLAKALIGKKTYKMVEVFILIYSLGIIIGF